MADGIFSNRDAPHQKMRDEKMFWFDFSFFCVFKLPDGWLCYNTEQMLR